MWQSLRLDLPVTPVHGLLIKNDDLVIGTHGRSFYIMDNIGVLRQAQRETTNEASRRSSIRADAVRDRCRAASIVDYLPEAAGGCGHDRVPRRAGQSIRNFTERRPDSRGRTPPRRRSRAEEEGGGRGGPVGTCDRRAGHEPVHLGHAISERTRVSRPDHVGRKHPGPAGAAGRISASSSRLTASRRPRRSRSGATPPSERHRCRISSSSSGWRSSINDKVSAANEAVVRIRSLKDQIADRVGKTTNAAVKQAGEALADRADGRGRGDLPAPEPQQPGSAEFPDSPEQQACGAAGNRRERRLQADRSSRTPSSRSSPDRLDKELARLEALVKVGCSRR